MAAASQAHARGAGLLLTPELALCGYAAEDLYLRPAFIDACDAAVQQLAEASAQWPGMALVLGAVCLVLLVWSFFGGMIERRVPEAASEAMRWGDQLTYTFRNRAFVPYVLGSLFVQTSIAVILARSPSTSGTPCAHRRERAACCSG